MMIFKNYYHRNGMKMMKQNVYQICVQSYDNILHPRGRTFTNSLLERTCYTFDDTQLTGLLNITRAIGYRKFG